MNLQAQIIALIQAHILRRFTFKSDRLAIISAELNIVEFDIFGFLHESKQAYQQFPLVVAYIESLTGCLYQINACREKGQISATYNESKAQAFLIYFRNCVTKMGYSNITFEPFVPVLKTVEAYS
jgi:hypothetical protein